MTTVFVPLSVFVWYSTLFRISLWTFLAILDEYVKVVYTRYAGNINQLIADRNVPQHFIPSLSINYIHMQTKQSTILQVCSESLGHKLIVRRDSMTLFLPFPRNIRMENGRLAIQQGNVNKHGVTLSSISSLSHHT